MNEQRCPTCGQLVSVHTSYEGTSCYVGEEYNRAIEDAAKASDALQLDGANSMVRLEAHLISNAIRALKK